MGINDQTPSMANGSAGIRFFSSAQQINNAQMDPIVEVFEKDIAPQFKEQTGFDLVNIKLVDKLVFPTLITVAVDSEGKASQAVVTYFSGTNTSATKTVDSYLAELGEITNNPKLKGSSIDILLQDNINNDAVINIIVDAINEKLGTTSQVSICAIHTMAKRDELDANTNVQVACRIVDELLMAMCVETDLRNDVTMKSLSSTDWSVNFEVVNDAKQQTKSDIFGHTYARQFSITSKGTITTNTQALGVAEKQQSLITSKLHAVMDFRFDNVQEQNRQTGMVDSRTVAVPEMVITKYESDTPSLTSFFLNLANAVQVMSNKNFAYTVHLNSLESTDPVTNLNFILNTERNENGLGKLPKVKDWSSDDVIKFLNNNVVPETIVSIKVDPTCSESYFNYILLGAAGTNGGNATAFNKLLISIVERLIGSSLNFDGNVFMNTAVKYPVGTFTNKIGVNSFDGVNINEFIGAINGQNAADVIFSLNESNINPNSCIMINDRTFDSFVCILNALSEAGIKHGHVTGTGVKLTFNPEFISALVNAVNGTGFVPVVSGPTVTADQVSRTIASGALGLGANGRFNTNSYGGRTFVTGGSLGFRRF